MHNVDSALLISRVLLLKAFNGSLCIDISFVELFLSIVIVVIALIDIILHALLVGGQLQAVTVGDLTLGAEEIGDHCEHRGQNTGGTDTAPEGFSAIGGTSIACGAYLKTKAKATKDSPFEGLLQKVLTLTSSGTIVALEINDQK